MDALTCPICGVPPEESDGAPFGLPFVVFCERPFPRPHRLGIVGSGREGAIRSWNALVSPHPSSTVQREDREDGARSREDGSASGCGGR